MVFIEEIKSNTYLIKVFVKPNSKKQEIAPIHLEDDYLTVYLRSKPIQNKANKELLSLLKKKLHNWILSIEISNGFKSSNKIILVKGDNKVTKNEILNLLKS